MEDIVLESALDIEKQKNQEENKSQKCSKSDVEDFESNNSFSKEAKNF